MKRLCLLIPLLCFCPSYPALLPLTVAVAQDDVVPPTPIPQPKAIISDYNGGSPPESINAGEVLYLSAKQSVCGDLAESVRWIVLPADRAQRMKVLEHGRTIVIPAGLESVTITVQQAVALRDAVDVTTLTIPVKGANPQPIPPGPTPPGPTPPGPTPPTPTKYGLNLIVGLALRPSVTPQTSAEWINLASEYELVASQAERNNYQSVDDMIGDTGTKTRNVLKTQKATWDRLGSTIIKPVLDAYADKGTLKTLADHAVAWREIAAGIRIAAGTTAELMQSVGVPDA